MLLADLFQMSAMNEFDLQMWERELSAWQRRLERQPPGALRSALHELAARLHALREHPSADPPGSDDLWVRADLLRRFATLRALYEQEDEDVLAHC
jgi:hypothetical protein